MEKQTLFSYWDDVILSHKDTGERTMPKDYSRNELKTKLCLKEDPFQDAVLPVGVLTVNPLKEDVG